jgi:5'-phosphate synthase pdxT subunit
MAAQRFIAGYANLEPSQSGRTVETSLASAALRMSPRSRGIRIYIQSLAMKIGVLALQGDFDAHRRRLRELGAEVVLVKKPQQLDEVDALVIPGGESTTFLKLLGDAGFQKLKDFVHLKPTFGTCAGAILLAREVGNPPQPGLGALDVSIRRNAYGRQVDSSIRQGASKLGIDPLEMVFIRAPKFENLGPNVEVLATEGNDPVLIRQGRVVAATFHPELSEDKRVHQYFLDMVRNGQ